MKIHIVQKGDTLQDIAEQYNVEYDELVKINSQIANPNVIAPGMKLMIPQQSQQLKQERKSLREEGNTKAQRRETGLDESKSKLNNNDEDFLKSSDVEKIKGRRKVEKSRKKDQQPLKVPTRPMGESIADESKTKQQPFTPFHPDRLMMESPTPFRNEDSLHQNNRFQITEIKQKNRSHSYSMHRDDGKPYQSQSQRGHYKNKPTQKGHNHQRGQKPRHQHSPTMYPRCAHCLKPMYMEQSPKFPPNEHHAIRPYNGPYVPREVSRR